MKRSVIFAVCLFSLSAFAVAQVGRRPFSPKGEIFGYVGSQSVYDYNFSLTELEYGAAFGVYVTKSLELECDVSYASGFEGLSTFFYGDGDGLSELSARNLWMEGNVLYHYVNEGPFRPYFIVGLGNVRREHREEVLEVWDIPPDIAYPGQIFTDIKNYVSYSFGTGAKIFFKKNLAFRFEYKWAGVDGDAVHRVRAGLSILF